MNTGQNIAAETIKLEFYQESHMEQLKSFYLAEEQEKFTALPVQALEDAKGDQLRFPIVILAEGRAVGFFVLNLNQEFQAFVRNPNAILLRAFSVNTHEQGKGYAKKGLSMLPQFVRTHFPDVNEIVLAVNMKNEAASRLYLKCGFVDKGLIKEGNIGPQYVLQYCLQ